MKKFLAILGSLLIVAVLGITAFFSSLPRSAPPSAETVEVTPARLARGDYLFNAVLGCPVCHSERDFSLFGAPPGQPFGGGRACAKPGEPLPGLADSGGLTIRLPGFVVAIVAHLGGGVCGRSVSLDESGFGRWRPPCSRWMLKPS